MMIAIIVVVGPSLAFKKLFQEPLHANINGFSLCFQHNHFYFYCFYCYLHLLLGFCSPLMNLFIQLKIKGKRKVVMIRRGYLPDKGGKVKKLSDICFKN